jgi:hypothetical membrane protein
VQAIAQAASARPFSLATNLISDLGDTACGPALCSPLHPLVNATFIAVGSLHWFGALANLGAWPPPVRNRARAGLALLVVAGWALVLVGLSPENLAPERHRVNALLGLVCLDLSMLVLGTALWELVRTLGLLSLLAGTLGLIALGLFLWAPGIVLPVGFSERLADYPSAAMVVVLGAYLLQRTLRAGPASAGGPAGRHPT